MVELVEEGKTKYKNQLKIPFHQPPAINFSSDLFNTKSTSKTKLDFIKHKNLYTSKNTIKKVKRQPTRENICIYVSHKCLISRLHKEFLQLSNKKTNNTIF